MRILDRLIDWWLRHCPHNSSWVAADVLEGTTDVEIKYCRRCGAMRPSHSSEWRRPRPLWFPS